MVPVGDVLRGDGLIRVHDALAAIEEEFRQADRVISRFDGPPPAYATYSSGTTTRSQSLDPPTQEQRKRDERRDELMLARRCSEAYRQFRQQAIEETKRIWEADRNGTRRLRVGENPSTMADENVKNWWVEQGIWNDRWASKRSIGQWKHQEPLETESDYESDPEAPLRPLLSSQPKLRRLKSEEKRRQIAERRGIREREREASRPYHQFIYQMSRERERIHKETGEADNFAENINTKAYEAVKDRWHQRNIWVAEWGIMPGMSWSHEKPWDQAIAELGLMSPVTEHEPLSPSSQARQPLLFDDPNPSQPFAFAAFETPPVQARDVQTVKRSYPSEVGRLVNENTNRSIDGEAAVSLPTPKSPQAHVDQGHRSGRGKARSCAGRRQATSTGLSLENLANALLGPKHSSKVSKPASKKRPRTTQLNVTSKKTSAVGPTSSQSTQPRRSPRLRPTASTRQNDIDQGSNTPQQKKTPAGTSSPKSAVKPRGVTKQQSGKNGTRTIKPPATKRVMQRKAK